MATILRQVSKHTSRVTYQARIKSKGAIIARKFFAKRIDAKRCAQRIENDQAMLDNIGRSTPHKSATI